MQRRERLSGTPNTAAAASWQLLPLHQAPLLLTAAAALGANADAGGVRALLQRPTSIGLPVSGAGTGQQPSAPAAPPAPEPSRPPAAPPAPESAAARPPPPPPAPEPAAAVDRGVTPSAPAPSTESGGGGALSGGNCPDPRAVLDAHNRERAGRDAQALTWSAELAGVAQRSAERCQLQVG